MSYEIELIDDNTAEVTCQDCGGKLIVTVEYERSEAEVGIMSDYVVAAVNTADERSTCECGELDELAVASIEEAVAEYADFARQQAEADRQEGEY